MTYLNAEEFSELGFDKATDFDKLAKRAKVAIDLYTRNFYSYVDFDSDLDYRKSAVKLATAFQIAYLDASGIMTADEKQSMTSISVGRTSISYGNSKSAPGGQQFNLSLDAENALRQAGFSLIVGVEYDR